MPNAVPYAKVLCQSTDTRQIANGHSGKEMVLNVIVGPAKQIVIQSAGRQVTCR